MDAADLYIEVFDKLLVHQIDTLTGLLADARVGAAAVRDATLPTGKHARPRTDEPLVLLTILLGLAQALAYADPDRDVVDKQGMESHSIRYGLEGRLNQDRAEGALIFTRAIPARPHSVNSPNQHHELVPELIRVPRRILDEVHLSAASALDDLRLAGPRPGPGEEWIGTPTLKVGQLPFLAGPSDVIWTRHEDPDGTGQDAYTVVPSSDDLIDRVGSALEAIVHTDAHVVVLPEASLDDRLLHAWQGLLAGRDPDHLHWIMAGTGPVGSETGSAPNSRQPNRAVVLNQLGDIVFSQDKRFGFTLDEQQIARYGLVSKLGAEGSLNEHLIHGTTLQVVNTSSGRFAVAICEDEARLIETGRLCGAVGVTHLLVPVIAPAMWSSGWQALAARHLAGELGVSTLVSNSNAIECERMSDEDSSGPAPTLLMVSAPRRGPVTNYPRTEVKMTSLGIRCVDPVEDALTVRLADW